MRIIERYITKSIVWSFLAAVVIFSLLFILIDSASNLDEFIGRKVEMVILVRYYLAYLPFFLVQAAPMALLIACLLSYSNFNSHNEVIVLRTAGLNFWQITRPALAFVLVISAGVFLLNERYVPQAQEKANQIWRDNLTLEAARSDKKKPKIENLTFYGLNNRLYFIDSFDPNTFELSGVTIVGYNNQNIEEKIVALSGQWTGQAWKFTKCQITTFDQNVNNPIKVKIYEEKMMAIPETPTDFMRQRLNVSSMNIKQLLDYIRRFSNSGAERALNNLRVDVHQKIAFPLVNIVVVLVGLPLVLSSGRRKAQTFTSLGIAVVVGFAYHVVNAVGLALGKGGLFPPIMAAWLAPVFFTAFALYLINENF